MMFRITTSLLLVSLLLSGCRSTQPTASITSISSRSDCVEQTTDVYVDQRQRLDGPHTIGEYVEIGLSQSPVIAEATHRLEATRNRRPQASSLPDPMLNTSTYLAPVQTAAGEQDLAIGISQKFTNKSRLATQTAIVDNEISSAESRLNNVIIQVADDIRQVCYQIVQLQQIIEITKQDIESLNLIARVVEQQYSVKKTVTQQDVLNVRKEQSDVENKLTDMDNKLRLYRLRLARLLHVDANSSLILVEAEALDPGVLSADQLLEYAMDSRPDLQAQLSVIQQDQNRIALAELQHVPDVTVGLNWIATSSSGISPVANGDDAVLLGVGFNLPIRKSRICAAVSEARANSLASMNRLEILKDAAAEEVFGLVDKIESTQQMLILMREDIIPNSERIFDLSLDKYANGDIRFVQLIENWRSLNKSRMAEKTLSGELSRAYSALNRSVGSLDSIPAQPPVMR